MTTIKQSYLDLIKRNIDAEVAYTINKAEVTMQFAKTQIHNAEKQRDCDHEWHPTFYIGVSNHYACKKCHSGVTLSSSEVRQADEDDERTHN